MEGWLLVNDVIPKKKYVVFRFNNKDNWPSDSNFEEAKYDSKHEFTALKEIYKYKTDPIMSNSEAYFVAVPMEDKPTTERIYSKKIK
jgi:hypothetical protein